MAARIVVLAALASTSAALSSFYVDCSKGSDAAAGTAAAPWATLSRAQQAARSAQPAQPPGVSVFVQGDCVSRDAHGAFANTTLLSLNASDSGASPDAPTVWAAWPGAAPARLLGGVTVPPSAWSPAPAVAAGTLVADLSSAGLDIARFGFGALGAGGLGTCADTAIELFVDGAAQVLARYPNIAPDGTWQWVEIEHVDNTESAYVINGTAAARALTWPTATSPGASAWVHGYWSYDWADSYCEIKTVTSDGHGNAIINIEPNTPPVYGFLPHARFYGVNILSELDVSFEYFIDVEKELLYWMPPPGGVSMTHEVVLSISENLIIGTGVSNIAFDGLGLFYARGTGLQLSGAVNATVRSCTSANHGHSGIDLYGSGIMMRDSHVYDTGCEATSVGGGDLNTLTPSGNVVTNNSVHHFARVTRTYNPGIRFSDVGGHYANNTIAHGPHTGMTGGGALNLFENNTFDSLLFEASTRERST